MSHKRLLTLSVLMTLAFIITACGPADKPDPTALPYTPRAWDTEPTQGAVKLVGDPVSGEIIFQDQCANCHSIKEGENITGPSLFNAGQILPYDYVKESVLDPHEQIVFVENAQFTDAEMPTNFAEMLSDQQIEDVVAYVLFLTKDTSASPGR